MKKKNKIKIQTTTTSDFNVNTLIKIFVGVILVLALTYFIGGLLNGTIHLGGKKKKTEEETVIQYSEILAGESFTRNEDSYYVLYGNLESKEFDSIETYRLTYSYKENSLKIYEVDTTKNFNTSIVANKDEIYASKPSSINELKVYGTTLLKFNNHKVVERIEGTEEVTNYLNSLIK